MGIDTGIISIHGKQYKTVALRVSEFRKNHEDFSITTDLISNDSNMVIMKASISNESGRVIGTGYAEEDRLKGNINKTSAIENCETSAIGRALAAFGLAGSEYASANEVETAIYQQKKNQIKENWYDDFEKQKSVMLSKIQSGDQTPQGIIDALKSKGYMLSTETINKIKGLKK